MTQPLLIKNSNTKTNPKVGSKEHCSLLKLQRNIATGGRTHCLILVRILTLTLTYFTTKNP